MTKYVLKVLLTVPSCGSLLTDSQVPTSKDYYGHNQIRKPRPDKEVTSSRLLLPFSFTNNKKKNFTIYIGIGVPISRAMLASWVMQVDSALMQPI